MAPLGAQTTALLFAACAFFSSCHELYPDCSSLPAGLSEIKFAEGETTEEHDSDGGVVKLTFRFHPRVIRSGLENHFIELDIRMTVNFSGVLGRENTTEDPIRQCIGLASLHLIRLRDDETVFNTTEYYDAHDVNYFKLLKFFDNFREFEIKAKFTSSVPVGYVLVNKTCWEEERKYSHCIQSLQVEERMKTALSVTDPFSREFWESMKEYLHQRLGGELLRLHMAFPLDHNNVLFRWLMWMLDEEHVDIYDFRMSSSDYNPTWGSLNTSWLQVMPLLTRMDLSNNGITTIQPDYLTSAKNLTALNLGRNRLASIPPEIYGLSKLAFLDLSRNPFVNVGSFFEAKHLKSLPHVNFLNISHVPIRDINLIIPMLREVSKEVKPMKLAVLDLSFCDLKDFDKHPDLFSEQNNMTHLYLSGNRMGSSPRLNFPNQHSLMTVDLSFNNLTTPLHILDQGQVVNLNLSLNNITGWSNYYPDSPDETISVFGHVEHLNLSLNTIPALTLVMAESLEELKTVDLGDNPIDCENCNISQFQKWLIRYQNNYDPAKVIIKFLNNTVTDFYCTRPSELNTTLVSELILGENPACSKGEKNFVMLFGVPLAAISSLLILLGIAL